MKTRYRIKFNGSLYTIERQLVSFSCWKKHSFKRYWEQISTNSYDGSKIPYYEKNILNVQIEIDELKNYDRIQHHLRKHQWKVVKYCER